MRSNSFAGQVVAALSRRATAFEPKDTRLHNFPDRLVALLHRHRPDTSTPSTHSWTKWWNYIKTKIFMLTKINLIIPGVELHTVGALRATGLFAFAAIIMSIAAFLIATPPVIDNAFSPNTQTTSPATPTNTTSTDIEPPNTEPPNTGVPNAAPLGPVSLGVVSPRGESRGTELPGGSPNAAFPAIWGGEISYPQGGQRVPTNFVAQGEILAIPPQYHAWLAVRVGDLMWPRMPEINPTDQQWSTHIVQDGNPGNFSLVLLMVDPAGNNEINHWLLQGRSSGEFPGLTHISQMVQLDEVDNLRLK